MSKFNNFPKLVSVPSNTDTFLIYDADAGNVKQVDFALVQPATVRTQASTNPTAQGDLVFELTNNTTLTIKVRGTDNIIRSATLILS